MLSHSCLWGLDITSEELLRGSGTLLFKFLWVVLALVGLKQLIRVGSRRDDHSGVGASPEDTSIMHDILRNVFRLTNSVGVLILLFALDDSWCRRKTIVLVVA